MSTSNIFSGSITADSAAVAGALSAGSLQIGGTKTVGGRVFSSLADSAAIPQLDSYATFSTNYSIPTSTLVAGSILRIRAVVRITTVLQGAGSKAQSRLLLGGVNFGTSALSAAGAVGTRCTIDACFTTRADPGASVATPGTCMLVWSDDPAVITAFPGNGVPVPSLATNGAILVAVAAQSSAAGDGTGRLVLEQLIVDIT
jgi:hypothetical protein